MRERPRRGVRREAVPRRRSAAPPRSTPARCATRSSPTPAVLRRRAAQGRHHDGLRADRRHDGDGFCGSPRVAAAVAIFDGGRRRRRAAQPASGGRTGSDSPGQQSLLDGRQRARDRRLRRRRGEVPRGDLSSTPSSTTPTGDWRAILYGQKKYRRRSSCCGARPIRPISTCASSSASTSTRRRTRRRRRRCGCSRTSSRSGPTSYAAQLQLGQHLVKTEPKRAAAALEAYLKYRPPSAASLDPQIHMLLGTAYLYAKDWESAQREFEGLLKTKPNDMTAKLMLGAGARRQERLQPGHLALRAHPRRGAASSRASTTTSAAATCARSAPPTRCARPSSTSRPSRTTPRATCSCATRSTSRRTIRRALGRVPAGGAAGSGQRRDQGQGRPHLPRHEELPVGGDLPRAGGGRRQGVGCGPRIPRCWARSPRRTRRCTRRTTS